MTARLGNHEAETELRAAPAVGAGIVIRLEDVDHGARGDVVGRILQVFARMMSEFLPKAHGLMAPGG